MTQRTRMFFVSLVAASQVLTNDAWASQSGPAPSSTVPASGETPVTGETPATSETPATPPTTDLVTPPHEVMLQGGGFLRGTVVVLERGTRVVLELEGGEQREIPWSQVAGITGENLPGGSVDAPAATPEPVPEAPPQRFTSETSGIYVHLDLTRDRRVSLYEVTDEIVATGYGGSLRAMSYRSVCVAPCNLEVGASSGQQFFLMTADKLRTASRRFTLSELGNSVAIKVKPGNPGMRLAGTILMSIGIAGTIAGTVFLIAGAKLSDAEMRTIGAVGLGVGVPSLAAGIPMKVLGRTRYEMSDHSRDPDSR